MLESTLGRTPIFLLCAVLASASLLGCDSSEEEEAPVDEVVLVGSVVGSDFLSTGMFELVATPLDPAGRSVLSRGVSVAVSIDSVNGSAVSGVSAQAGAIGVNTPSNNQLAIAISIDNSSSMLFTDPERTRVDGALEFVDALERTGVDYEALVAIFGPNFRLDADTLFQTTLLYPYTNIADSLRAAIEKVGENAGTPTYESLLDVLYYSEAERPTAQYERAIVMLSDGAPNSTALRDSACATALALDSPIYAIGLGPASDLSPNPSPEAVNEMRFIASCTGGAYAGIAPDDLTSVGTIYSSIGTATAQGSLNIPVQLSGADFEALDEGDVVRGTVTMSSGGGSADAKFGFRVPSASQRLSPGRPELGL